VLLRSAATAANRQLLVPPFSFWKALFSRPRAGLPDRDGGMRECESE